MTKPSKQSQDNLNNHDDALIQELLSQTSYTPKTPKHGGEGLLHGTQTLLQGAVGACGMAVLAPAVAASQGHQEAGVVGAVVGAVGGAVGGIVQATNVLGGSVVSSVTQVVQGVVATPKAIVAPTKGYWWNSNEGRWVQTNLLEEERWILSQPKWDEDILGDALVPKEEDDDDEKDKDDTNKPKPPQPQKQVKDMYYYDLLGLDPSVDASMIKRRYYIIARKYSPDRCGANAKANEEFYQIGRAYMILANDELRERYDKVGRQGLWSDDDNEDDMDPPDIDPFLLTTLLFGSETMDAYIGRLVAATLARLGLEFDESKLTHGQARVVQRRRVTKLALQLSERLRPWAEDGLEQSARATWMTELEDLVQTSYGIPLVHAIGKAYSLAAIQFLGSIESGIGRPSMSAWAQRQVVTMKEATRRLQERATSGEFVLLTKTNKAHHHHKTQLQKATQTAIDKSADDEELQVLAQDIMKQSSYLQQEALAWLWKQTVVDVAQTIHETVQMVLHDVNVSAQVRETRAVALQALGELMEQATATSSTSISKYHPDEQAELEEIAFHAILDTVWRQELAARAVRNKKYKE